MSGRAVSDDSTGDDDPRRSCEPLNEPQPDQKFDGGRNDAQCAGSEAGRGPRDERWATTVPIGQLPDDELSTGQADQECCHGQLYR